jgi:subtilase family serine protease
MAASLYPVSTSAQMVQAITGNHPAMLPVGWPSAPDSLQVDLVAVLALRNTRQLTQLEADLQNRHSPHYHQWLTTDQFVAHFGPTKDQMTEIASWLAQQGFTVTSSDQRTRRVYFTGTEATIRKALGTSLVSDGTNYVNTSDPVVPADLAPTVQAILGLSSLPHLLASDSRSSGTRKRSTRSPGRFLSDAVINGVGPTFAPADLYNFYNEMPARNGGNLGTGAPDCVGLPELGDVTGGAVEKFNSQFKLPPVSLKRILVNDQNPGLPGDNEPALDVEWVHAVAPKTPIYVYLASSKTPYLDAITRAVDDNVCGAISGSVEDSCPDVKTLQAYNSVLEQGVVQGQTFFHSAGDYGDNWPCGNVNSQPPIYDDQSSCGTVPSTGTGSQPSVDEEAASPFITSVGGTQFTPIYLSGFDASVIGDGLEVVWNVGDEKSDNCPSKDATGGGKSVVFPKPAWQTGFNVPDDGARDVPDIALGADGSSPGFFVYSREAGESSATLVAAGGTSIASPIWAAISRLIAQSQGVTRLGNINPRLYELGNLQSPSTGLHDVTTGDNDNGEIPGYSAGSGYDQVTGWGTPNIALLIAAFPGAALTATPAEISIKPGSSFEASTFSIANTTSDALQLTRITVGVKSPRLFSALQAGAAAGGITEQVLVTPSKRNILVFPSPMLIPAGQSAQVTLTLAAANKLGLSSLTLGSGAVGINDGAGGIIEVTGLPVALAIKTISNNTSSSRRNHWSIMRPSRR